MNTYVRTYTHIYTSVDDSDVMEWGQCSLIRHMSHICPIYMQVLAAVCDGVGAVLSFTSYVPYMSHICTGVGDSV